MPHQRSTNNDEAMLQESEDNCGSSLDSTYVPDEDYGDECDIQIEELSGENEEVSRIRGRNVMGRYEAWVARHNSKVGDDESSDSKYARVTKPLHEMNDEELNYWLSKFFREVRMHDGREYKPLTLNSLRVGLQSYLKEKTKTLINLLADPRFLVFQRNYHAEIRRLNKKGCGVRKMPKRNFSPEYEEIMWSHGILGCQSPHVLLQTMVYLNLKNLGLKRGTAHRSLKRSNVTFVEINDTEHLRYFSDGCPTSANPKGSPPKEVIVPPNLKMPDRCHVRLCQLYFSKCGLFSENHFYVAPVKVIPLPPKPWFSNLPVGHNTLSKMITDMYKQAKSLSCEHMPMPDESIDNGLYSEDSVESAPAGDAQTDSDDENYATPIAKRQRIAMDHDIIVNDIVSFAECEAAGPAHAADIGLQCNLAQSQDMHLMNGASTVYYINNCNVTINNNQMQRPESPRKTT